MGVTEDVMGDSDELIPKEDLDDIIGEAARRKDMAEEALTVKEIEDVASELDIGPEYVEQAMKELERRRKAKAREAKEGERTKKVVVGALAGALALFFVVTLVGKSSLSSKLERTKQARAQMVNVMDRKKDTLKTYGKAADSPDKLAALEGADNRIRVERRRYDEAATAYNTAVSSFPGSMWAGIFGMPDHVALSSEISAWRAK